MGFLIYFIIHLKQYLIQLVINIQKSYMSKRITLKDLPEEQMAKVKQLVQRLEEEKNEKNKYKNLYDRLTVDYEELKKKYDELDRNHSFVKAQLSNSKMAIIKAKQAYNANKSAQKKRKLQKESDDENQQWENAKEEPEQPEYRKLFQTQMKTRSPYIFEDSQNKSATMNFGEGTKIYEKPPLGSHSKQKKQRNSSKKKEIINLRKEIEQLTQQMKNKERSDLPFSQKMKQCQAIRNKYKKSTNTLMSNQSEEEVEQKEKTPERKKEEQKVEKFQLSEKRQKMKESTISVTMKESTTKKATKTGKTQEYDQSFFDIIDHLNGH